MCRFYESKGHHTEGCYKYVVANATLKSRMNFNLCSNLMSCQRLHIYNNTKSTFSYDS
jgi:hypothetical protein